jgi:hypothetical protein
VFGVTIRAAIVPSGSYEPLLTSEPLIVTLPPGPSWTEIFLHNATGGRTGFISFSAALILNNDIKRKRKISQTEVPGAF